MERPQAGTSPITVVRPDEIDFAPYDAPMDYIRHPFHVAHPIHAELGRTIQTPDIEEGLGRALPAREGFWAGVYVIGPGGGEEWHTHLSYYDVVYYVIEGEVTIGWRASNGREDSATVGPGSLYYIAPAATHRWINTGDGDLKVMTMIHFHDFSRVE